MTKSRTFRDYEWQNIMLINPNPQTAEDNLENFYRPLFERTKTYRRITGFFSSSVLSYLCEGIGELIENDGTMYLITSSEISRKDAEAVKRSEQFKEELLMKSWDELMIEVEGNAVVKSNLEALSWLLANGRLKLKIGFNIRDGKILSNDDSKFHEKIAIYEDYYGDKLLVLGSSNESLSGYTHNRESVSIQESWKHNLCIDQFTKEFEDLWGNGDPNSIVMDVPVALERQLIKFVPEDPNYRFRKEKVLHDHQSLEKDSETESPRELRTYQQIAIDSWENAGYKGILNMATGTGKTFTALSAIKQKCSLEEGILLIVVPQSEIAKQWEKNCILIFGKSTSILMCNGYNSTWKKDIEFKLYESAIEFKVIIVTNNTFARDYFFDFISPYLKRITMIADEVHEIGAPKAKEKLELLNKIPKRLGLSATPERMRDPDGNNAIARFFGNQIYYFSMRDAIYPPSGDLRDRYLCPYRYYIHYSSLTSTELDTYCKLSEDIKKYYSPNQEPESLRAKKYDHLCRLRSMVVKGSENRLKILEDILRQYDPDLNPAIDDTYSKCIIYCNTTKESSQIYEMMHNFDLNAVQYHNNIKNRESILETFATSSFIRYVISIACLDQGVDLPVCDGAIILSSTTNERQYIQRRGRVLRTNDGKKKMAYIHDVVVTPYEYDDLITEKKYLDELESNMVSKQINRVGIFIDDSDNSAECESKLLDLKKVL